MTEHQSRTMKMILGSGLRKDAPLPERPCRNSTSSLRVTVYPSSTSGQAMSRRPGLSNPKWTCNKSPTLMLFLFLMTIPVQLFFVFVLGHLLAPFLNDTSHRSFSFLGLCSITPDFPRWDIFRGARLRNQSTMTFVWVRKTPGSP